MSTAAALGGCSPLAAINALTPKYGYILESDVAYGELPRQQLDIYRPQPRAGGQLSPAVVFFYGGGWDSGAKAHYLFVAQALVAQGVVVVIPDYRLFPEVRFPTFVEDGAQAVGWVLTNIDRYGADPNQVYLIGHSAGAHIAALLTLDTSYGVATDIRGLVGVAGPYDFLPLESDKLKAIFAMDNLRSTQPIRFANRAAPPVLLLAGAEDTVVEPGNSTRLAAALRAQGSAARAIIYPDVGHRQIIGALAWPLRGLAPTLADIRAFLFTCDKPSQDS